MLVIFGKVASIFITMLVGIVLYKAHVLDDGAIKPITELIMKVCGPCLIVSSLYSKEFSRSIISDTVAVMVGCVLFYILASLLTYVFLRCFKVGSRADEGAYIVAVAATNSGFMGFPIISTLYGKDMLYLMVMGNILLNVYMFVAEPSILAIGEERTTSPLKDFLRSLKTPIVISLLIGFAMLLLHIRPTGVIDDTVTMLGEVTIPISMILVGLRLGSVDLKAIISSANIKVSLFSMIVIPALTLAAVYPISSISNEAKIILVMTAAMPTAVLSAIIAEERGQNSTLISEIVSLTTLISVVTIPAVAAVLELLYR